MKKIPMRQCIGCGEMKGKKEMMRVIKTAENDICLDVTGKKNGRGAYVLMKIAEFEEYCEDKASLQLMSELLQAKSSSYVTSEDVVNYFKDKINEL